MPFAHERALHHLSARLQYASSRCRGCVMLKFVRFPVGFLLTAAVAVSAATAQPLEVKRYNPSPWTKGRFSEVVTVNGPGKTIYLAGIGAEDERGAAGASAPILHPGNPYE